MTGWPPSKGELEELYLERKLSAEDIAVHFGRTGKYPGAIVYHYLRKYDIPIRDRTAHQRHMSEGEIATCVVKYQSGKSLWDLADEYHFSAETIRKALISHGVKTRDKVEAQIQKVTKYQKHPFSGDPHEKAYLYGLRQGDLWVTRHGRAIRVKTSSTHPAMENLLKDLFGGHGPIHVTPKHTTTNGSYEKSYDVDLDQSYEFLLQNSEDLPDFCLHDQSLALSCVSGFIDAEGSILLHRKQYGFGFEVTVTNTDLTILKSIGRILESRGIHTSISQSGKLGTGGGIDTKLQVWRLVIWRKGDVLALLRVLSLRHPEKMAKTTLVFSLASLPPSASEDVIAAWRCLIQGIKEEVKAYVISAQREYERRHTPPT